LVSLQGRGRRGNRWFPYREGVVGETVGFPTLKDKAIGVKIAIDEIKEPEQIIEEEEG
jgi:hypothetical protein